MRPLQKPSQDPGAVYALCISRVKKPALKRRLEALQNSVEAAAIDYEQAASSGNLHMIPGTTVVGGVSKEEMVKIYKNRMAKAGVPGRPIYDDLILSPVNRRCPLCGQRDVSTLDHVLPEAHYTLLVVVPRNLVPACKDCNGIKKTITPKKKSEQFFHPYYDDFDDGLWLLGNVDYSRGVSVIFTVEWPDEWDSLKYERACFHFSKLKLNELYSEQAADELVGIKLSLTELFNAGGPYAVAEDLDRRARSRSVAQKNSWQAAFYRALADDEFFSGGAFHHI